ncbi:MAG: DUF4440 domain-containing protein [Acidobacteriaceae bacterium]
MSDKRLGLLKRVLLLCILLSSTSCMQGQPVEPGGQRAIDAGNQAWILGMKEGRAAVIGATYTEDAIDCGPGGDCIRGRAAIERQMKELFDRLGDATAAFVKSIGSVQQGSFIYEWGHAGATFANGKTVDSRYLTAWQKQQDGTWRIFRNLVIPQS